MFADIVTEVEQELLNKIELAVVKETLLKVQALVQQAEKHGASLEDLKQALRIWLSLVDEAYTISVKESDPYYAMAEAWLEQQTKKTGSEGQPQTKQQ